MSAGKAKFVQIICLKKFCFFRVEKILRKLEVHGNIHEGNINDEQKTEHFDRRRRSSRKTLDYTTESRKEKSPEHIQTESEVTDLLNLPSGSSITSQQKPAENQRQRQLSKERTPYLPKKKLDLVNQDCPEAVSDLETLTQPGVLINCKNYFLYR